MTDQEFDQLFDNGESILETLDLSTAHRINCPTDLMTNLSPAAQAVKDAAYTLAIGTGLRTRVASALQAAANQVVPVSDRPDPNNEFEYGQWLSKNTTRSYLLAIAAELEGTNG